MFVCLFIVVALHAFERKEMNACLEPGRLRQDCDSVEEVRGHENETTSERVVEDEHLLREAILDVGYYLRRFKFTGFDPRYLAEGENPRATLFAEFPSPPLRSIHWEVKKNCELSFFECVKYLQEQVIQTVLPRHLDSLTITKQNGWSFITDKDLIKSANDECLKLLENDEKTFNVFSGPLERFQWLTSASYYMCLYTMKETPSLKFFIENCDNFASCIQWEVGLSNEDSRGDNRRPFACALYSFCPDPCCPLKYLPDPFACAEATPCALHSAKDKTCRYSQKDNAHFESLVLNQWNISCRCNQPGMQWESKSGMCVDIDECTQLETVCDYPSESCRNLPGSYKCVCSSMGYRATSGEGTKRCVPDVTMHQIFHPPVSFLSYETKSFADKFYHLVNTFKSAVAVALLNKKAALNGTQIST